MKEKSRFKQIAVAAYGLVLVLFLMFFLYLGHFEGVSIHKARQTRGYNSVTDYTVETVEDPAAPAGIRKFYRWKMQQTHTNENCLSFYVVHQSVEVYFEEELLYSLMPGEHNRIGKSVSSNWVTVPVNPEDSGKEITVVITPLFREVIDRDLEFLVGSHYMVFFDCLSEDALELVLGVICVLMGLLVTLMQVYLAWKRKEPAMHMFFAGNFAVLLGMWRLCDTKSSAILFSGSTMLLGYITLGCLCICCIPLLLFMKERFADFESAPLLHISIIESCGALLILLCQVLGIAEFRETLTLCHVMLAITVVTVLISALLRLRRDRDHRSRRSWHYSILLAVGAAMDFASFYSDKNYSRFIYTMVAFLIYLLVLFVNNTIETSAMAYTDPHTGLVNKNRWDELMKGKTPLTGDVGIVMLDLNRLKYINDTMGHEAGDRMIFSFSNILRNTMPSSSVICRWGGDEFTVMMMDSSEARMEQCMQDLENAVEEYNRTGNTPTIHYAAGWVLAREFPGMSRKALLEEADARMYRNKKKWYADYLNVSY